MDLRLLILQWWQGLGFKYNTRIGTLDVYEYSTNLNINCKIMAGTLSFNNYITSDTGTRASGNVMPAGFITSAGSSIASSAIFYSNIVTSFNSNYNAVILGYV